MTEANKSPKATKKVPSAEAINNPANSETAPSAAVETSTDTGTAVKAKKEKPPALEDKPFADFVQQDLVPAIHSSLTTQGWTDLNLQFAKSPVVISGVSGIPDCWQITGRSLHSKRQFNLYFFDENIQGQRGFSCSSNQGQMSSIESFLIDERKMTLDLLMFGLMKRLNAQQWLSLTQPAAVS